MRHGAELVWIEHPRGDRWDGTLLTNRARDKWTGYQANYRAVILATGEEPWRYQLTTRGAHSGGTRHRVFADLSEAQAVGSAWARRRFYVED